MELSGERHGETGTAQVVNATVVQQQLSSCLFAAILADLGKTKSTFATQTGHCNYATTQG